MRETKNMKVEIIDKDHVFFNDQQFVSLKRFADAKRDMAEEVKLLADKNKELAEENEALKILLKDQLNETTDTPLVTNAICKIHEWECCSISTAETVYRCRKCNEYKRCPTEYIDVESITTLS